ncbi:hypothetical protein GJA_4009 [Janthinobacterium agaricidamnosum NBRC 102515 = DSM 9628]|uniref:AlgX/AlgJ SGNH hydrolase-like domain-containing protein n=2 Tax=Janthinobacterium agaricidamnosum TaxID=55508 RepID=W0V716_9BURK|nr:hypothetical protein GJA_4009 [Janthinobacterium agaricidamnosum NBRC 102515 = DSM 9628]
MALVLEVALQCVPVFSGLRLAASDAATPFSRYLPEQKYVYSFGWALDNARRGQTNLQGFTNSADFKDDARVLVIGDSFIESLMLDYPDTVQGRLDHALGGAVYAASSSGNGLADSLDVLAYYVPRIHPRNVVLFVEPNDLSDILAPAVRGHSNFEVSHGAVRVVHQAYTEPKAKLLVSRSALARYIYYSLRLPDWLSSKWRSLGRPAAASVAAAAATGPDPARGAAVEYYLNRLQALGAASGINFVFLVDGDRKALYGPGQVAPGWHGDDRQFFIASAEKHGYKVADMQPVFAAHWAARQERMDFLPMDGHWNPVAHALAAQQVLPLLD